MPNRTCSRLTGGALGTALLLGACRPETAAFRWVLPNGERGFCVAAGRSAKDADELLIAATNQGELRELITTYRSLTRDSQPLEVPVQFERSTVLLLADQLEGCAMSLAALRVSSSGAVQPYYVETGTSTCPQRGHAATTSVQILLVATDSLPRSGNRLFLDEESDRKDLLLKNPVVVGGIRCNDVPVPISSEPLPAH